MQLIISFLIAAILCYALRRLLSKMLLRDYTKIKQNFEVLRKKRNKRREEAYNSINNSIGNETIDEDTAIEVSDDLPEKIE